MSNGPVTEIYATLAGQIDTQLAQRVFNASAAAVNAGVKIVHLLVHSAGGGVGDAVGLYTYLHNLPLSLKTYNGGLVQSAAVLVFLAGKERYVSKAATFVLHKSTFMFPAPASAYTLQVRAQSLLIDDTRTEAILREHMTMPEERWKVHERADLTLTADESVQFGLAHGIGDFVPPPGIGLVNI